MANTTFKGTLRSGGGYSSIATASTGVETTQMSISSAGFTSLDANTMATEAGTGITGAGYCLQKLCNQRRWDYQDKYLD